MYTVAWRQATREYHLTSCTELLQTTPSPICTKIAPHICTCMSNITYTSHVFTWAAHMYPSPDFIKPNLCALLWAQKFLLSESQGDHYYKLPRFSNTCIKFDSSNMKDYLPLKSIWYNFGCPKQSSHLLFNVMFFLRKALLISPIPATSRGCGGSFSDTFQRHVLYTIVLLKSAYEISWVLFVNKACDSCQIIVRCKAKTTRSQPRIGNIGRMIWPLATILWTTPDPAHTQRKNIHPKLF